MIYLSDKSLGLILKSDRTISRDASGLEIHVVDVTACSDVETVVGKIVSAVSFDLGCKSYSILVEFLYIYIINNRYRRIVFADVFRYHFLGPLLLEYIKLWF